MNQMKRSLCALLSALMLLAMLAGCGKKQETDEPFVLGVSVCGAIDSLDPAMKRSPRGSAAPGRRSASRATPTRMQTAFFTRSTKT